MKGIELLSLSKEEKRLLKTSESNYKRFARIYFSIVKVEKDSIIIKVEQKKHESGKYLPAEQLTQRAKEVFSIIPKDIIVRAIPYNGNPLEGYGLKEITAEMQELGLQLKDLAKLLNLTNSGLSRLLTEGRKLTKVHKAMFYYLFQHLKSKTLL